MPVSQMQGIHNSLADLLNSVSLDTVQHYEDYIARLHQIPRAFEQMIEVLQQGEKDGLMPVRILIEEIPAQWQGRITEDTFLSSNLVPASISGPSMMKFSVEEACRSIGWRPASITGLKANFRTGLVDERAESPAA
jgi:uncharacterized protein (DUF885 family)